MEYVGLHTGSQGEGPLLHWPARLIGYVPLASLLAAAASLVCILSGARLSLPAGGSWEIRSKLHFLMEAKT